MDMQTVSNLIVPEGEVRTIHDKNNKLLWGKVFYSVKYAGDTVQNGTPTPSTPVDINFVTGGQTISINDGTESQSFTISLGSIELCKIGSYQDYIYKNDGVWYIHKETGKIDLTSTTGWWKSGSHTIKNSLANLGITNIHTTNQSLATEAKCNYFEATPTLPLYQGSITVGFGISDGFYFSNNDWSLNDFNAFKTDHTVLVYYALANAINTAITNTALIDQLNAVHEWLTRYGYSSTVSGSLPLIINKAVL